MNHSDETRIHLVLDTAGSSRFWDAVDNTLAHLNKNGDYPSPQRLAYKPGKQTSIFGYEEKGIPQYFSVLKNTK